MDAIIAQYGSQFVEVEDVSDKFTLSDLAQQYFEDFKCLAKKIDNLILLNFQMQYRSNSELSFVGELIDVDRDLFGRFTQMDSGIMNIFKQFYPAGLSSVGQAVLIADGFYGPGINVNPLNITEPDINTTNFCSVSMMIMLDIGLPTAPPDPPVHP